MKHSIDYKLISYHIIFWIFQIIFNRYDSIFHPGDNYLMVWVDILCAQGTNIVLVYLIIFLCSRYTVPIKIVPLTIGIIILYCWYFLMWYEISFALRPFLNNTPVPKFNFLYQVVIVFWVFVKFAFFGFGYAICMKVIKREKNMAMIEKGKIEAEYAFLRAQINPHFLFNTLSLFYAKSLPLSEELSDGIVTLSQIMRYSLEKNEHSKMVLLSDELEHVNNVIKINQMRFSNQLQIDLKIEDTFPSIQIVPLIIITIVENVLKHGDCTLAKDPAVIHLFNSEDGYFIHLYTYNRKKKTLIKSVNGIGMENIKKRLDYHYGDNYELIVDNNDDFYMLKLKLPVFHQADFYS